jgi:glutathione-independent formaldehyde dehydrogenase
MSRNKAVVYKAPYHMAVEDIGYPTLTIQGKPIQHGVILQVLATNICGTDLHLYRGRTGLESSLPVGHEITGMVIEKGTDVAFLEIGDIVSVPCNVACGRCRNCKAQDTHLCLTTNDQPGAAYGYVGMGPWQGGQAEYVMVPYADFNLLKFPDADMAKEKLLDLAMLSDIFPTGFHGALNAGVGVGKTVYIAGAGPVGLCVAISSYLLGAACVIMGDINPERLRHAKNTLGCETIDLHEPAAISDQIFDILNVPEVDCGIDAIGYEAHGHGLAADREDPTNPIDTLINVSRHGSCLGIVGVYTSNDPKSTTALGQVGRPAFQLGKAWFKSLTFATGITPVMRYNRQLMNAILFNRVQLSQVLNTTPIPLDEAPQAYQAFDSGVAQKFVLDPQGILQRQCAAAITATPQTEHLELAAALSM